MCLGRVMLLHINESNGGHGLNAPELFATAAFVGAAPPETATIQGGQFPRQTHNIFDVRDSRWNKTAETLVYRKRTNSTCAETRAAFPRTGISGAQHALNGQRRKEQRHGSRRVAKRENTVKSPEFDSQSEPIQNCVHALVVRLLCDTLVRGPQFLHLHVFGCARFWCDSGNGCRMAFRSDPFFLFISVRPVTHRTCLYRWRPSAVRYHSVPGRPIRPWRSLNRASDRSGSKTGCSRIEALKRAS
jgi:hypothetical protein